MGVTVCGCLSVCPRTPTAGTISSNAKTTPACLFIREPRRTSVELAALLPWIEFVSDGRIIKHAPRGNTFADWIQRNLALFASGHPIGTPRFKMTTGSQRSWLGYSAFNRLQSFRPGD